MNEEKLIVALRDCIEALLPYESELGIHGPAHRAINLLSDLGLGWKPERCAECGETWPCTDSRRQDLAFWYLAKHRRAQ